MINSSMKEGRFGETFADLSFVKPNDTACPRDELRKTCWVNDCLLGRAQEAHNPDQDGAADESMIPCASKWCPMPQVMRLKPIKLGIKVFCYCMSKTNYLWNWRVYLGKNEELEVPYVFNIITNELLPECSRVFGRHEHCHPHGLFSKHFSNGVFVLLVHARRHALTERKKRAAREGTYW